MSKDMKLIMESFKRAMNEQMGGIGMPLKTGVATAAGKLDQSQEARRKKHRELVGSIASMPSGETHIEIQYSDLSLPRLPSRSFPLSSIDHGDLVGDIVEEMNDIYTKKYTGSGPHTSSAFDYDPDAAAAAEEDFFDNGKRSSAVVIETSFKIEPRIIAHCLLGALQKFGLA